jgi:hypothetical protein
LFVHHILGTAKVVFLIARLHARNSIRFNFYKRVALGELADGVIGGVFGFVCFDFVFIFKFNKADSINEIAICVYKFISRNTNYKTKPKP